MLSELAFGQQLLTLEGGTNAMIFNTRSIDDEYKFVDITNHKGFEIGSTLKLNRDSKVDGKILINYTNSGFHINSTFDKDYEYGNADVDVSINALRFAYLIDYTVGRKTQFFINAGPSFAWLFNVTMDGNQTTTIVEGTVHTDYPEVLQGTQRNVVSRGIFSLYTKSGFVFPINRKTSFQISAQLIYDLNNHTRDYLAIAANNSLNNLLYLNFCAGLSYDVGKILSDKEWDEDW